MEKDSSVDPISLAKCTGYLLLNSGKLKGTKNCLRIMKNGVEEDEDDEEVKEVRENAQFMHAWR